jgi:hypothetical protein
MGHELSFYRQKRHDGGIRTAVTADGVTVLHRFQPGDAPSDPALLWYVDLRCSGRRLPVEPEATRQWLLAQSPIVRDNLTRLASKLEAGMDVEPWPFQWQVPRPPRGVRMTIVCSAVRRLPMLEIASILIDLCENWDEWLRELEVPQALAS